MSDAGLLVGGRNKNSLKDREAAAVAPQVVDLSLFSGLKLLDQICSQSKKAPS